MAKKFNKNYNFYIKNGMKSVVCAKSLKISRAFGAKVSNIPSTTYA